jgi:hypothetical protein
MSYDNESDSEPITPQEEGDSSDAMVVMHSVHNELTGAKSHRVL